MTQLIVDEAHCVDQSGRDFRREYARLDEVRRKLGSPPVLAFTATAGIDFCDAAFIRKNGKISYVMKQLE